MVSAICARKLQQQVVDGVWRRIPVNIYPMGGSPKESVKGCPLSMGQKNLPQETCDTKPRIVTIFLGRSRARLLSRGSLSILSIKATPGFCLPPFVNGGISKIAHSPPSECYEIR